MFTRLGMTILQRRIDLLNVMSPSKKLIGELTEKSGPCTPKVKIVQKLRPVCSPKKTKYQRYVMQDEKVC